MSKSAEVAQIKAQYANLRNDPIMNGAENLGALQAQLNAETAARNQAQNANPELAAALAEVQRGKSAAEAEHKELQAEHRGQEQLIAKVELYLEDFEENSQNVTLEEPSADIAGELAQLNIEE